MADASTLENLIGYLREKGRETADTLSDPKKAYLTANDLAGRGLAAAAGAPVDLVSTLANLGIAGYGTAKHALTGSNDLPDLLPEQRGGSEWMGKKLEQAGLISPERYPLAEGIVNVAAPLAAKVNPAAVASALREAGSTAARGARNTATAAMIGTKEALPLERPPARAPAARVVDRPSTDELPTIDPSMLDEPAAAAPPPPEETLRETIERQARERDPQASLEGMEPTPRQRLDQADADTARLRMQELREQTRPEPPAGYPTDRYGATQWAPPVQQVSPETQAALYDARSRERQSRYDVERLGIDELQQGRTPDEDLRATLLRENDILQAKERRRRNEPPDLPYSESEENDYGLRQQQGRVRSVYQALDQANETPPQQPKPLWAYEAGQLPSRRDISRIPQARDWPPGEFPDAAVYLPPKNAEESMFKPPDPAHTVAAFLREAQKRPEMFQYGGAPPRGTDTIEDWAQHMGEQAGQRIQVKYKGIDPSAVDEYDEPYKIEKTHGEGEVMRDQYGDIKQEPKEHDFGDAPMYDEQGNVKKDKVGLDEEGNPIKEQREAQGGEPWRDRYGDQKYRFTKSTGGETVYDERGDPVEIENPDYRPPDPQGRTMILSTQDPKTGRSGNISTEGWDGDEPETLATAANGQGALLYQTLFGQAAREGRTLPSNSGLTYANTLRLLQNGLVTAAREGRNPRGMYGTSSGTRAPAERYGQSRPAQGPDIWRALTGETESRLTDTDRRGYEGLQHRIQFDPERGFLADNEPISQSDINRRIREFSPLVQKIEGEAGAEPTRVGAKTLQQAAMYRWLEKATPEEAAEVAKNWAYGPMFGALGATGLAGAVASQLRDDGSKTD